MSFVKLESVHSTTIDGVKKYINNGSIIVNSSHIIDIYKLDNYSKLSSSAAKDYEKILDLPVYKLCILRITLVDNRYWDIIAPEQKFEEFK